MRYYFHAIRKIDVILAAEIAERIKTVDGTAEFSLLLTKYPQFDYADTDLSASFGEVLYLPFCGYSKNLFAGFAASRRHRRTLESLDVADGSAFFFFDDTELACFNIYEKIARERSRGKKIKLIHLVYVLNPLFYGLMKSEPDVPRSIFDSLYTLPLFGSRLSVRRLKNNPAVHCVTTDAKIFDKEVFFYRKAPPGFESEFDDMTLPFAPAAPTEFSAALKLEKGAVIFLVDTLKGWVDDRKKWARITGAVLDELEKKFAGSPVYLKMHPTDIAGDYNGLGVERFKLIDRRVLAETVFASNRDGIKAVYSFSSSANYASASCGIPSYYIYPLFGLDAETQEYLTKLHLWNNLDLRLIKKIEEIDPDYLPACAGRSSGEETNRRKWSALCEYVAR